MIKPGVPAPNLAPLMGSDNLRERGGVTRGQAEEHEPHDRHHEDDLDRAGHAPGEVAPHFLPSNQTPK